MTTSDHAHDVFLVGLRNAHAMEKQALSILQPQLNRLEQYPDLLQRLESHRSETEAQIDRLDQILAATGESSSSIKDTFLSAVGSMAALTHAAADDEVLKNTFANLAFENFEIAAYTSLITSARLAGKSDAIPLLEQSLDEERRMAEWIAQHVESVTETYISLKATDETAKA